MVKVPRLITLSDENNSFQAWKKLFHEKDDNFSGWVQQKLIEELERHLDSSYIHTKLAEIENQKCYWENQLNKSKEIQTAKEQAIIKEEPKTREQIERDFDILIKRIGSALEFRFSSEYPSEQIVENLAIEYDELKDKPSIDDFLESKGYTRKIIIKREVLL